MSFSWRTTVGVWMVIGAMGTCCCQSADDCSQMDSCDGCISGDVSVNLTGCLWKLCENENATRCVSSSEEVDGCSVLNDTSMCSASNSSMPSGSGTDASPEPTSVYSQAKFDLSSFIGGIILVLGLQAAGFFALKFVKTKDSSYETIDQPQ